MLSFTSTGTELRRFRRGLLPRLAVGAMILVPLLYGALYLWAFWDPTGNLDRLPVALVDADSGATLDGKPLDAGQQVTDELVDSGDLDWRVTDADDAASGVADGTYYFAVTIPSDFSADVASAGGDAPTAATIQVTYNDANSFLASTLGKSAMAQVQAAVSGTIGDQAVDQVLVGLGSARDGFATASDGALTLRAASGDLSDGAHQVADGATSAADGAATLASGAATLSSGTDDLASGAASLASGASTLSSGAGSAAAGASALSEGAHRLADGAGTAAASGIRLADGAAQVAAGVDDAAGKVSGIAAGLPALGTAVQQAATDLGTLAQGGTVDSATAAAHAQALAAAASALPSGDTLSGMGGDLARLQTGAHEVSDGAAALNGGLGALASSSTDLATGAGSLAEGTAQVAGGAADLATGAGTLSNGAARLQTGSHTLADGAASLDTGLGTLADGAGQVADGTDQVGDGAQQLADGLTAGADQIPDDTAAQRDARADVISKPVSLGDSAIARAEGFGEGFAPFFIPLALFVGALITWLLLRPVPTRALATPVAGWRTALAGYLPALAIGVAQVAVMLAVIHWGVGLQMSTALGTIAFTLLIAATFLALQQMLMAVLGPAAGKVAVLALLMLQLASSGGTYPVETTPAFFRAIHPLLPMSYAVTGLRQTITGGADGRLWVSVAVLGGVLVASLAITAWRSGRLRTWTMDRLHPVLAI
ncbi:YhgE/Pip domain-containing protein [Cellulomonas triticagri]|uniref:YhgE/Pip domain-containing protein n=1 Tax=Cellulomonas triticagri TaxID=2483352 RepID=A0A3M2IT74_9CELL|nr:YhgE/Pip domain-containing protein [Cellulomonas triticagri]RMI05132.1 YhgE/Pip domain-containing protein [Cellulomonas triticagri]